MNIHYATPKGALKSSGLNYRNACLAQHDHFEKTIMEKKEKNMTKVTKLR